MNCNIFKTNWGRIQWTYQITCEIEKWNIFEGFLHHYCTSWRPETSHRYYIQCTLKRWHWDDLSNANHSATFLLKYKIHLVQKQNSIHERTLFRVQFSRRQWKLLENAAPECRAKVCFFQDRMRFDSPWANLYYAVRASDVRRMVKNRYVDSSTGNCHPRA